MRDELARDVDRREGQAAPSQPRDSRPPRQGDLSNAMRDLLWRVAQHKYGWTCVQRYRGEPQVAAALVRRGLVTLAGPSHARVIFATGAGLAEITRRWPVSPFVLGTYQHQPGGWTPREGVGA